ncbi:hypothetical protein H5410_013731 [Solanum commersonii]|uniref:Uncharacterized protein n=1 Tax=Solanum commersonii TaxID=4109 RepID=A0A9J5ZP71_SOLCO|nr:hypothetical protein H5410_013731 [Solanum commersonii]
MPMVKTPRLQIWWIHTIHGSILNWFSYMRWDSLSHQNFSHNSPTGNSSNSIFHWKFVTISAPNFSTVVCVT